MSEPTLKELWQFERTKELFGNQLARLDKKLYKMDDELLYYTIMRAESILDYRANKESEDEI